jgi:hypothetical protein
MWEEVVQTYQGRGGGNEIYHFILDYHSNVQLLFEFLLLIYMKARVLKTGEFSLKTNKIENSKHN